MAFDKTKFEVLHRGTVGGMALASYNTNTPNHGRGAGAPAPAANLDYLGADVAGNTGDRILDDDYFPASEVPASGLIVFVEARSVGTLNSNVRATATVRVYHSGDDVKAVSQGTIALT